MGEKVYCKPKYCELCGGETQTVDSRATGSMPNSLKAVWRRRKCKQCGNMYTTYEVTKADIKALIKAAEEAESMQLHMKKLLSWNTGG